MLNLTFNLNSVVNFLKLIKVRFVVFLILARPMRKLSTGGNTNLYNFSERQFENKYKQL